MKLTNIEAEIKAYNGESIVTAYNEETKEKTYLTFKVAMIECLMVPDEVDAMEAIYRNNLAKMIYESTGDFELLPKDAVKIQELAKLRYLTKTDRQLPVISVFAPLHQYLDGTVEDGK